MTKDRSKAQIIFEQEKEHYDEILKDYEKHKKQLKSETSKLLQLGSEYSELLKAEQKNKDPSETKSLERKRATIFANSIDTEAKIEVLKRQIEAFETDMDNAHLPLEKARNDLEGERHSWAVEQARRAGNLDALKANNEELSLQLKKQELELKAKNPYSEQEIARMQIQAKGQENQQNAELQRDLQSSGHSHEDHMTRLKALIQKDLDDLKQGRDLEFLNAETQSDVFKAREHGEIHRENVSHETDEKIRLETALTMLRNEEASHSTNLSAKTMLLKHLLDKDFLSHKFALGSESKLENLEEAQEILKGLEQMKIEDGTNKN